MGYQRVRDPLHNLIEFNDKKFEKHMWKVIQSEPFQRLRRIKQLGFSEIVYPGATHSRFAHSLGVFHTARMLTRIIQEHDPALHDPERESQALAAALVHDVGHGPFSHAFETVGKRLNLKFAKHELVSNELIRSGEIAEVLTSFGSGFASDVADLIKKSGKQDIYSAVVSSQFDADRLDYMRRDRLMTGTHHGAIDFEWLLSNLEVGEAKFGVDEVQLSSIPTFVLGPKAIFAAETYVLALFQLYPTVYLHKATRGMEKMFGELMFQLVTLVRDGSEGKTGLPSNHPLILFAKHPEVLGNAMALDDTVVMGSIENLVNAPDQCLSVLAASVKGRTLHKCIDIREIAKTKLLEAADWSDLKAATDSSFKMLSDKRFKCVEQIKLRQALERSLKEQIIGDYLDRACAKTFELLSRPDRIHDKPPSILLDETIRKPYRAMEESEGPLETILMRTEGNELLDVAEVSNVVAAIKDFKLLRAYVDRNDGTAAREVDEAIQEGVNYAMAS